MHYNWIYLKLNLRKHIYFFGGNSYSSTTLLMIWRIVIIVLYHVSCIFVNWGIMRMRVWRMIVQGSKKWIFWMNVLKVWLDFMWLGLKFCNCCEFIILFHVVRLRFCVWFPSNHEIALIFFFCHGFFEERSFSPKEEGAKL